MSLKEKGVLSENHVQYPKDEFAEEPDFGYYDNNIKELMQEFFKSVMSDGRFSWMGLFTIIDAPHHPHLVAYLQEKTFPPTKPQDVFQRTTVNEAFADLALALRPKLELTGLYYLTPTDGKEGITEGGIQGLGEEIKRLYETEEVRIVCSWSLPIDPIEL